MRVVNVDGIPVDADDDIPDEVVVEWVRQQLAGEPEVDEDEDDPNEFKGR